ncbi:hypothetical protein [Streptomyces sp. CC224B]|uniref:hypothetical protein n=1 Tax=Streptomyces sp. CC224B TaxID=3044571 RepID=UPI0024A8D117|nr:hypothetical protein [Streptomyces sp. CC224B]
MVDVSGECGPARLGVEMRETTFPDGTRGLITVQAGLSQDEVDLAAAEVWADASGGRRGKGREAS